MLLHMFLDKNGKSQLIKILSLVSLEYLLSNNKMSQPYLFFSLTCPYSRELIGLISQNKSLSSKIQYIDINVIHDTASRVPIQIFATPTIYVVSHYANGQVFIGKNASDWVRSQNLRAAI